MSFHFVSAYRYLRTGQLDKALEELDEAKYSEEDRAYLFSEFLFLKGLTYVEMVSLDDAQKTAEELKALIEKGRNKREMRYYDNLMGRIALKRDNFSLAIEYFKKAKDMLLSQDYPPIHIYYLTNPEDHILFIDSLANAYYKSGSFDEALAEYESITKLTTGRLYYGDIYARSFYMLGKIYEEQGDTARAIEHYEKFFDLWKDADPGIAEVEDTKKGLAALRSN